ncbi:3-hydroxybenzoate 6-monooxygenase, partial [Salmonella enterica subsp. enterica serovar Bredeney]|nr:3-hydroxybenzoate 6-monooxygenase [Salmonella enterica subsp. enterica serovar Bredeney]
MTHVTSAIIVGGGIGGAATALSLARQGIKVMLLEKAHEIGEIGAGIQLGPNAFSALDSLGVGDVARQRAVFTDHITMMDAVNAEEVVCIETGQAFRDHFGGPYAVIHRVDIHATVWEAALTHPGVEYRTSTHIVDIRQTPDDVTVFDEQGNSWTADILVGCDGVKSVVRQSLLGDAPRVTGHVVYRAVIDCDDMPDDLRINAPVLWAGPHCHLVHYPLRGGQQYNLVVTFHSRQQEEWGVKDGSKEEVLSYFAGIHPRPRQMLDKPTSW